MWKSILIWNVDYFDRSAVSVTCIFLYEVIKNTENYSPFSLAYNIIGDIVANVVKTSRWNYACADSSSHGTAPPLLRKAKSYKEELLGDSV